MPITTATGYAVSFPDMAGAAGALTSAAEELRAELVSLHRTVDVLLGPGWRGRAAAGFTHGWQQWHAAAVDVLAALDTLAELVRTGGVGYEATDTGVRQAVTAG